MTSLIIIPIIAKTPLVNDKKQTVHKRTLKHPKYQLTTAAQTIVQH